MFAENITEAGRIYLDNPAETPFIPTWARVHAADPDLMRMRKEAAELDFAEIG